MPKVFISYHHDNDQDFKNEISSWAATYGLFEDVSVDTGDIDDDYRTSERIRQIIRDDFLRDSEVTLVLVGSDTHGRKHVDWEIKSSMIDGRVNAKSGIVVVMLPGSGGSTVRVAFDGEKENLYPEIKSWYSIADRSEFEKVYPNLPFRLYDNIRKPGVKIPVTTWNHIQGNPSHLGVLVENSARNASQNDYDLSIPMRRRNSPG